MTKIIFAERVNSEFKHAEAFRCGVKIVENGKSYARLDIIDPLKAYRYMVMLARKEYVKIDPECKAMVLAEVNKAKEAAPKAEEAKTAEAPAQEQATEKKEAPAKPKRQRKESNNKKEKAA